MFKAFMDYKEGKECGLSFKARYFDDILFPSTDIMRLGQYFEYICTGGLPKDGKIPEPDYMKSGKDMLAPYRNAHLQKEVFELTLKHYGITIKHTNEDAKWRLENASCDIDFIGVATRPIGQFIKEGDEIICDIKFTGLIENKWEERGWELESLPYKPKLLIQAIHYKWMGLKKHGKEMPFIFFLHSNTNDIDAKLILVNLDSTRLDEHERIVEQTLIDVHEEAEKGFKPYPERKRCNDCALATSCEHFRLAPKIYPIYY